LEDLGLTDESLGKLLDVAETHARAVLVGSEQQLPPIFDLEGADGQRYIVATPFSGEDADDVIGNKDMVARMVRELIREKGVVRYSFLSEAWMIVRPSSWQDGMGAPPSEADDRVEVVVALATDGVDYRARRWRIKRDGAQCIDLVFDSQDEEVSSGGGRFDNLLSPRPNA
jgi:hypothetical protein